MYGTAASLAALLNMTEAEAQKSSTVAFLEAHLTTASEDANERLGRSEDLASPSQQLIQWVLKKAANSVQAVRHASLMTKAPLVLFFDPEKLEQSWKRIASSGSSYVYVTGDDIVELD